MYYKLKSDALVYFIVGSIIKSWPAVLLLKQNSIKMVQLINNGEEKT